VALERTLVDGRAPAVRSLGRAGHGVRGAILIRRLAAALVAVSMALLSLHGCTALRPGDDRGHSTTDSLDAGVHIASTCAHREPPPRPKVDGGGGDLDLVFAVSSNSFGTATVDDTGRPAYQGYGFDLDNTCTGEGQLDSCIEPPWASASHTDGVEGIDNAAAVFGVRWFGPAPDPMMVTNAMVANQIFRIRGYNGAPDDDQVDFAVYVGFGIAPRGDGGSTLQWDGHDAWMILTDTLTRDPSFDVPTFILDQPQYHDDHAYVSGGVLGARLPQAMWPTGLAAAPSALHLVEQLVFAGNLVQVGEQWEMPHLVIGVRERVQDGLALGARFSRSTGSPPTCQSALAYQMFKTLACSLVDISAGPDSPTAPCDALSGGSVVEAKQAVLGGIGPRAELYPNPECAPGIDPDNDSCGP
jgi:hypothetical protein